MKLFFVTATDTDVGKTFFCSHVSNALEQRGQDVAYLKLVQCGAPTDSAVIQVACPKVRVLEPLLSFDEPISPNQAARKQELQDCTVSFLMTTLKERLDTEKPEICLMEGAGGLKVPLNEAEDWLTFLRELLFWYPKTEVVVVTRSTLGTLNHTRLTLDALQELSPRRIRTVLSGKMTTDLEQQNLQDLKAFYRRIDFYALPDPANPKWSAALQELSDALEEDPPATPSGKTKNCWHPYTQHQTESIDLWWEQGKDAWIRTQDGHYLIDGIGSWWVNTLGHCRPDFAAWMKEQQGRLDQVIFAAAGHRYGEELAAHLVKLSQEHFSKVFYSDNGSTAVEVALKMAHQYHANQGSRRSLFLAFDRGYHGDTIGTMAVGKSSGFFDCFEPLFFKALYHPIVEERDDQEQMEANLNQLRSVLDTHQQDLVAAVIEPKVMGAGGMVFQSSTWLQQVVCLLREYGVLVIFDEVFTGFHRLGEESFAFQTLETQPDILCLAKGLTAGTMPLSATLCREDIFLAFKGPTKKEAFLHGHSYTGNPLSTFMAQKILQLYEDLEVGKHVLEMEEVYQQFAFQNAERMTHRRAQGSVFAFEIKTNAEEGYFNQIGPVFREICYGKGLFIRPLGNTVYLCPAYTTDKNLLKQSLTILDESLGELKL